jgi:hypothetical protein
MNRGAVEQADQIKWWDALDWLVGRMGDPNAARGLQLARECRHPDALWLVSLFPDDPDAAVSRERMVEAMHAQGEHPLAMMLAGEFEVDWALVERAAQTGYAPAQAQAAMRLNGRRAVAWAEAGVAQGDRRAMYELACRLYHGIGSCARDEQRAMRLFQQSAELGDAAARYDYGDMAFGVFDWERYHWWNLSGAQGFRGFGCLEPIIEALLPYFERQQKGRVLHLLAPLLRVGLEEEEDLLFDVPVSVETMVNPVFELHAAMLARARQAIACWSVVGRRNGIVKDIRVMVAKMAWEQVWVWHEATGPLVWTWG